MIIKNDKELKQNNFKNEKELQTYFEKNLKTILKYDFIETEFSVGDFRIDTLAFDKETNSFRIIEYKNVKNHSLLDQGYTYLKLLIERKADFVLKYNEKTHSNLKVSDIEWSQSRIIFVSPVYTIYQLNATNFKNIAIDLIQVTRYDEDIVDIELIKKTSNTKIEDIETIVQKEVGREIKVYTEEDHLAVASEKIKEVYENLKNRILELDDIDMDVKQLYIAFKGRRNITDIEFTKNKLKVNINVKKGTLDDPLGLAQDISNIGHWGNGDYRVEITSEEEIDALIPLIKQSVKINKK